MLIEHFCSILDTFLIDGALIYLFMYKQTINLVKFYLKTYSQKISREKLAFFLKFDKTVWRFPNAPVNITWNYLASIFESQKAVTVIY